MPDASAPGDASVEVGFVGHATVCLGLGGVTVLTDPFLRSRLGPLERHGPLPTELADLDIDLVLISHGHPDHFYAESLASLRGSPTVVVPRGLGARAWQVVRGEVIEVAAGDRIEFSLEADGSVSMRPARHSARELYGYLARPGRRAPGAVEADFEVAEALAKDQERIRRSRG